MKLTTDRIKELASRSKRIPLPGQTDLHMESRTFRHDLQLALNELLEYRDAEEQAERELANSVEETGADPSKFTLAGTPRLMPARAIKIEGTIS